MHFGQFQSPIFHRRRKIGDFAFITFRFLVEETIQKTTKQSCHDYFKYVERNKKGLLRTTKIKYTTKMLLKTIVNQDLDVEKDVIKGRK